MASIFTSEWRDAPASVLHGATVVAIGDVHGCLALLRELIEHLKAAVFSGRPDDCLILLGDYVDRGPASLETLSFVKDLALEAGQTIKLLGNHDFFLALIVGDDEIDVAFVESWLDVGGESTFRELGLSREHLYRLPLDEVRDLVRRRLPPGAATFLGGLAPYHRLGRYVFAHAGLIPTTPLEDHDVSDLVLIREPFLAGTGWLHDVTVVHGHTVRGHEVLPHRIAVDTGAFRTGLLTCVQLERDRLRWIVSSANDLTALRSLKGAPAAPLRYAAVGT